jgi:hypothetical protein
VIGDILERHGSYSELKRLRFRWRHCGQEESTDAPVVILGDDGFAVIGISSPEFFKRERVGEDTFFITRSLAVSLFSFFKMGGDGGKSLLWPSQSETNLNKGILESRGGRLPMSLVRTRMQTTFRDWSGDGGGCEEFSMQSTLDFTELGSVVSEMRTEDEFPTFFASAF